MAVEDNELAAVRSWLLRLDQRLDALEAHDGDAQSGRVGWQYQSVQDWVEQWFVVHFARSTLSGHRWCPRWWDHNEAVLVLTALWRSHELARRDADAGIARWLTQFAYPLVRELFDYDGTFANCTSDLHSVPTALPIEPDMGSQS